MTGHKISPLAISLTIAAATILQSACQTCPAPKSGATVKCGGINACKGTTMCKSQRNDCKGSNLCKGNGWIAKSAFECEKAGGIPW